CTKEEELVKTQEISTQGLSKENIVEFINSYKIICKKRPKRTSYYSEN
ncbi:31207_t:CDS:1, partial [Gigaspora margarita]